jgi:hypothetical protein
VTLRVLALVGANLLILGLGTGLLPLLRLAGTRRDLLVKLPLGYAIGLAATGVIASELALVHVPVGWLALALLAAGSLVLGLRRVECGSLRPRRPRIGELPALVVLAVAAAFLVSAARLFAVKPLWETDGWLIWALRARALYDYGHPVSPIFTSPVYDGTSYPLWLPSLEALDFRAMRTFDGTLVHLQLLGIAIGFVGGAWVLLREHAPKLLLASALAAILAAPSFFNQLQTNFADVPLAMLLALGVAALAVWIRRGGPGLLEAAALFLAAAVLTKAEGELFVLSAFVVAAVVVGRERLRPLGLAALAVLAVDLPWRIWLAAHHVHSYFSFTRLLSYSYLSGHTWRLSPTLSELDRQLRSTASWSYLAVLVVVGLCGAVLLRELRLAAFAAGWLLLSFAGLVAVYWISPLPVTDHLSNSADRTIDSLVIGATLLVPVLLGPGPAPRMLRA